MKVIKHVSLRSVNAANDTSADHRIMRIIRSKSSRARIARIFEKRRRFHAHAYIGGVCSIDCRSLLRLYPDVRYQCQTQIEGDVLCSLAQLRHCQV